MKYSVTTKDLPEDQRPDEKCLKYGPGVLTDAELLAVIIRTGTRGNTSIEVARSILLESKNGEEILNVHHKSISDLMKIKGVGKVKALQIKCIGELSKRIAKANANKQLCFTDPATIANYYMEDFRHEGQEQMLLLLLDTKNWLISEKIISKGTVKSSLISPREIMIEAVRIEAVNIILLHNHPSGDATPSRDDVLLTRRVKEAGDLIGIQLLDHIVIGDNRYTSFRENGIIK